MSVGDNSLAIFSGKSGDRTGGAYPAGLSNSKPVFTMYYRRNVRLRRLSLHKEASA